MKKLFLAMAYFFVCASAQAGPSNVHVDSLDPTNRAYLEKFCSYHPSSGLCFFNPNPPVRHIPSPPGGGDDPIYAGPVPVPPAPPPAVCKGSGKVTPVTNSAQFQAVLNAAHGGDTILLKPGTYGNLNINKGGSGAGAPIYIAAENPAVNVSAQPQSVARSTVTTMVIAASNITVCGLYFDDRTYKSIRHDKRADNITYLQNYFSTGVKNSMNVEQAIDTWEGGTNLTLQSNYFNATRNSGFAQDYGIAVFKYNGFYARSNVFDGVFNHAISLKQGVNNAFIDGNVFKGCGQVCLEIGQTQDFVGDIANTGVGATITNNIFIYAYNTHPQGRSTKGLLLRNQQNIVVRGNDFQSRFYNTIITDFQNRGGLERLADRKLGIWGTRQDSILIENNKFNNGLLLFMGRGTGKSDNIVLRGNTGSFSCNIKPLQEAAGKVYAWETIDRDAPTVTGCH